ncbi:hypothetical protein [Paenibacillus sp. QZ-Y1]|uniref:hypothetical protein n=1 Tax=Paenibacillus sp. QZ-Y1 TaxID=3414511 RepID=UPI003F7AF9A3
MSCCLVIQTADDVWIGSDSAISTSINNNSYRVSDDGEKLFEIDNFVIFCSGSLLLSYRIMDIFKKTKERSISALSTIAKTEYECSPIPNKNLDIVVCLVTDKTEVIQLSPYLDFVPKHNFVMGNEIGLFVAGIKTQEAEEKAIELINNQIKVSEIFLNTFSYLSCEEVGGFLSVFRLNKNDNKKIIYQKIAENNIRLIENFNTPQNLIIAERIIGKLLLGNKLIISDNDGTFTIEGNLLTIKDKQGNIRVQLGEYKPGVYGLKIVSPKGTVMIDENGIVQTDTIQLADNVDATHALKLKFYISPSTLRYDQFQLNFTLENFRAYSKGAASAYIDLHTTESERIDLTTTEERSFQATSTEPENVYGSTQTEGVYVGQGGHNHGWADGLKFKDINGITREWQSSGNHQHAVTLQPHTHRFTVPEHAHSITMPSHSHRITVPPHSHAIEYGIYEGTMATGVQVIIDGIARGSRYYSSENNVDITQWIQSPGWHTIELSSLQLGRINANLYMKTFVGA